MTSVSFKAASAWASQILKLFPTTGTLHKANGESESEPREKHKNYFMLPKCIFSLSHARAALHDNDSTQIIFLEIKRGKIALIEFLHTQKKKNHSAILSVSECFHVFWFIQRLFKEFHQIFFCCLILGCLSVMWLEQFTDHQTKRNRAAWHEWKRRSERWGGAAVCSDGIPAVHESQCDR